MRDLSAFILLSIFLTSCASLVPAPQTIEVTRQVEITRLVTVSPEPLPRAHVFPGRMPDPPSRRGLLAL